MLRYIEGPADVHTRLDSSMRPECGCETSDFIEDEYREVGVVMDGNYKRKMVASLDKNFLEPQNWRQSAPVYVGQFDGDWARRKEFGANIGRQARKDHNDRFIMALSRKL